MSAHGSWKNSTDTQVTLETQEPNMSSNKAVASDGCLALSCWHPWRACQLLKLAIAASGQMKQSWR